MDKNMRKPKELFAPIKERPMEFTIILDGMLKIERKRVQKCIEDHGGTFCGYDYNGECINLANTKYKAKPNETIIDVSYVKKCVNKNKLFDLKDFQLSGKKCKCKNCIPLEVIFAAEKCSHLMSPKEILELMNKIGRETPKA